MERQSKSLPESQAEERRQEPDREVTNEEIESNQQGQSSREIPNFEEGESVDWDDDCESPREWLYGQGRGKSFEDGFRN